METTLPPLQAEEASSDQKLQQQDQIRSSEEAFRTLLSRATASIVFLASSLIVYYTLPFYPPAMSVFLAIVAGAVAYRWPAVALSIMLLFAAPAYSYQLGVTLWALSVPITIALVLPLGVSKLPGAALGSAVGAAAGALMLTPYFWLSLPLLAAVTLLRLKGSTAGGGWGLFMFLTFYLPFLFLIDTPVAAGETAPLFLQVDYPQPSALSSLDLDSLKTAFQGQLNNDVSGAPRFSQYF